jgi:ornithine carbamoyltransferase
MSPESPAASRSKRDFLTLGDFTREEYRQLFARARSLKARRQSGKLDTTLAGRILGLVFEKPSTRTRVSFEAAMFQLGGSAIALPMGDSQMSRGEPLRDTARVLASYLDAIVMRTFGDDRLAEMARHARVPVINGLSDGGHPVQILADLLTIEERLGQCQGQVVAWIGDGRSNMARSFIEATRIFDFELRIAAPAGYAPSAEEIAGLAGAKARVVQGPPEEMAKEASVVVTDVWASMGQEDEAARRRAAFRGYTVDGALVSRADPKAIVLHCLPAHRGEEITEEVLEGPQSAVFQEAENRLHAQKALLELLVLGELPAV